MSAHVSIRDMADLLHSRSDPLKPMVLMRAFFDESGMHGSSPVTGVAGFIAPAETWGFIEDQWREALSDLSSILGRTISQFHTTDCENGEGEWIGVSKDIREIFYARFVRIVCKAAHLKGTASFIEAVDWQTIATDEFKAHHGSIYQLCAEECFKRVAAWTRSPDNSNDLSIVYSEHQQFGPRTNQFLSAYVSVKPWSHVKSLTFAKQEDYAALQCADMLAYEMYVLHCKVRAHGIGFVMDSKREPMHAFLGKTTAFHLVGRGLALEVKRWHIENGLKDPYPDI